MPEMVDFHWTQPYNTRVRYRYQCPGSKSAAASAGISMREVCLLRAALQIFTVPRVFRAASGIFYDYMIVPQTILDMYRTVGSPPRCRSSLVGVWHEGLRKSQ